MLGRMLARRLLLLVAVLMLLTALAAAPAPPVNEAPQGERTDLPAGGTVTERIPADPGADSRVVVHRGDVLQLEVSGDTLDSVLIERLDRMAAIEPTTPARFEILVDAPA